jgi:hypothetical protein
VLLCFKCESTIQLDFFDFFEVTRNKQTRVVEVIYESTRKTTRVIHFGCIVELSPVELSSVKMSSVKMSVGQRELFESANKLRTFFQDGVDLAQRERDQCTHNLAKEEEKLAEATEASNRARDAVHKADERLSRVSAACKSFDPRIAGDAEKCMEEWSNATEIVRARHALCQNARVALDKAEVRLRTALKHQLDFEVKHPK